MARKKKRTCGKHCPNCNTKWGNSTVLCDKEKDGCGYNFQTGRYPRSPNGTRRKSNGQTVSIQSTVCLATIQKHGNGHVDKAEKWASIEARYLAIEKEIKELVS